MRICQNVITEMLSVIPENKTKFISALKDTIDRIAYKAPEDTQQWDFLSGVLSCYIPEPKEDWEFQVISIFTTKSVEELKKVYL